MSAEELKKKGNEYFSAKNFPEAITCFTQAIELDASNHVLYSNRSACYASINSWAKALEDAKKCVDLKPDWAKGYTRLGAALQGMRKYDEAIAAYEKGLKVDPNMEALKSGLANAQAAKAKPPHPLAQVFTPQLYPIILSSPKLAHLAKDKEFMDMVNTCIQNPDSINMYLGDPRMMELLSAVIKAPGQEEEEEAPKRPKTPPKKKEPERELTPEELEKKKIHEEAEVFKAKGNEHYKKKEFAEALAMYDKALETEPDNIQYMNNKAAVYLEQGDHEKCLAECDKAIEKGRETRGDFKDIAKAMSRKGASFQRQKNWDEAIKWYKESLLEHRNGDTLDKLNKCEAAKKKAEEEAYLNPELSEEAKNRGNEFFRNQQFKEAIDEYNEAIKRNPSNHALYSNRAAAYMKMGAYDEAEKDCEKCLKICPTFVKAIVRKAHIYFFRKEYHKAMVEYEKGLKLEPDNAECKNGVERTVMKIQEGSSAGGGDDEMRAKRAMADPEIQAILSDSYMQQVLREISENPKNLQHYLRSKDVMGKINKLIAAGIIKTA